MSVPVTNGGAMVVVTQVQTVTVPAPVEGNRAFSKGQPLALGAIQIMIGVVIFLFGIVMAIPAYTLGVYSGIFVWGAVLYVVAGSLTVAAARHDRRCLVNGALGVGITSTVISLTAVVLHTLDAFGILTYCYEYYCHHYSTLSQGFSAILALLHLLMMAVSITVSAFACNAVCCNPLPPQTHLIIQEAPKPADNDLPPAYS